MTAPALPRYRDIAENLLDRSFEQAAGPVLRVAARDVNGVLDERLAQVEAEAKRLEEKGERLTADNPVLRAFFADLDEATARQAAAMAKQSEKIAKAGSDAAGRVTRQLALPGFSDADLARFGVKWNSPDPEAVARLLDITGKPAWRELMATYGDVGNSIRNAVLRGILEGRGPMAIAREMRRMTESLLPWQANNIARTLQLVSYRQASAVWRIANADILEPYCIRIAALDSRTCMACVALHGKRVPAGRPIADHYSGRCDAVPVARGRNIQIRTGQEWFNALPPERQRAQFRNNATYEAWKAGDVRFEQFARRVTDPVFDEMVVQASLKSLMGDDARKYYRMN